MFGLIKDTGEGRFSKWKDFRASYFPLFMQLVWWMQGVKNYSDNQGLEGQIKKIDDKTNNKQTNKNPKRTNIVN